MRRLFPRVRFSLRSLGWMVMGVALACGWLLTSQKELDRQLAVVDSVGGASDVRFFAVRSVGFTDPSTITNQDVAKLAALPELEELYLPGAQVDDAAAEHFAQMRNLRILVLQNTKITDEGLKRIAELPSLEELRMSSCDISDAASERLASMKSLTRLGLWNTDISNASAKSLASLPRLKQLNIAMTLISPEGKDSISSSLPECEIIFWGNRVKGDRISDRSRAELR